LQPFTGNGDVSTSEQGVKQNITTQPRKEKKGKSLFLEEVILP
jgi:hypothetical protein